MTNKINYNNDLGEVLKINQEITLQQYKEDKTAEEFVKELERKRLEIEEISLKKDFTKRLNLVIKWLEADMQSPLTLAEKIIARDALQEAMNNNKELEGSTYDDGRYHNMHCCVRIPEAEVFARFYQYQGYPYGDVQVFMDKDEKTFLEYVSRKRWEALGGGI